MSLQAIVWALKQDIPNSSAKLLLISLANYADEDGVCWPSIDTLAKDCSSSRQTVMNATKRLVDTGVIEAKKRTGGSNYGAKSILYTLQIAESQRIRLSEKPKVQSVSPESQRIRPEPIIEPITTRKSTKKKKPDIPPDIDKDLWAEWMDVRLKKKSINSRRAVQALLNNLDECVKAGYTRTQAVTMAVEESWKSIKPEWIKNKLEKTHEASTGVQKPTRNEIHKQAYADYAARSMGGGAIREDAPAVWELMD